jgi:formimidoylglutamase
MLGVPFDGASVVRSGSRHGPDAIREAMGNHTMFATSANALIEVDVKDVGDLGVVLTDMRSTFAGLADAVEAFRRDRRGLVILGGDHSISWPILEGLTRASSGRVGVIHFDQHHDLREAHFGAESSGVPFRKAMNFDLNPVLGRNLTQIGIADFSNSPVHDRYAREEGVAVYSNAEVLACGIDGYVEEAIRRAADGTEAIHVSVDVDVIDQAQAPGTAAPNAYGLDARDLYRALRRIGREPSVMSLDIVEISPLLEPGNLSGNVGALLVLSFLLGVSERQADKEGRKSQQASPTSGTTP